MSDQAGGTEHSPGGSSFPPGKWWQSSRLFNQDVGLAPLLQPGDPRWMNVDRLQRSLPACFWPAFVPAPYISGSMQHPSLEISAEQRSKWRVSLDVAHFSPTEITVSVRDGSLEVAGKHGERPDEHGSTARCFTRKYRLPAEADVSKMVSTLSADGILTVEAPVPDACVPAAVVIPVKVEKEASGEEEGKHGRGETAETDRDGPKAPEARGVLSAEDYGKDSSLEVHGDQAHPGSSTAGLKQHEVRREQEEETHEQPAGESHPSENCQDSPEHHEAPDTVKEPEHGQPGVDGEILVTVVSGEAAEEPELGKGPPGEVRSQPLEVPDAGQEHAE